MNTLDRTLVGIDDMAAYIPQLYLPIADLAEIRQLEYAKLNKGLGLEAMAVNDVGEDAATMMANAVRQLMDRNQLDPRQIGRIYLGTESALDGAKPTATYALDMLSQHYTDTFGADCFLNCDVVDMTFACIGAVDAMQNTMDWVRCGDERIGIVVASDIAKYELGSGGEYTQGAGAVAVLIKENPRLLAFDGNFGVGTRAVHDFFKPVRKVKKGDLVSEVLHLANRNHVDVDALVRSFEQSIEVNGVMDSNENELSLYRETPVFDGQYSNACYQQRIGEALHHFKVQVGLASDDAVATLWDRLVFHLPYAYQARRMFGEIFWQEAQMRGWQEKLEAEMGLTEPQADDFADEAAFQKAQLKFWRAVTKTDEYRAFVQEKIEKGERASSLVGNMYTGSLFLSLMSSLEADLQDQSLAPQATYGCFAYGSGSKSKVFVGTLQAEWQTVVAGFGLMDRLAQRSPIDYLTYEQLHRGSLIQSVDASEDTFYLDKIHEEPGDHEGARYYRLGTGTAKVAVKK